MSKIEIRECPFCGANKDTKGYEPEFDRKALAVVCYACDACGPFERTKTDAIQAWNDRRPRQPDEAAAVVQSQNRDDSIPACRVRSVTEPVWLHHGEPQDDMPVDVDGIYTECVVCRVPQVLTTVELMCDKCARLCDMI
jgi:Lar family restriction alleviation protein